jgi:predicted RNA binding protein YcfA (HicA-like mRNA interferase family)
MTERRRKVPPGDEMDEIRQQNGDESSRGLRQLRADGWEIVRTRGSHRQLKHPTKPGLVTVSGKPNVDIPPGTLKNIWQQAQLED